MTRAAFLTLCTALLLPAGVRADERDNARKKTGFDRWEDEIRKIETRLRENPPDPGGIVFIGSSSIRLWKLQDAFPGLPAVNCGFGGSAIPDSTHFAPRILFPLKPSVVVFYAGDNDSSSGHSAERIAANFRKFAESVHASLPGAKLIFLPIKPSIQRWKLRPVQADANDRIAAWCRENSSWAQYVDTATPLLDTTGRPDPKFFQDDGLHLSPAGYAIWNDILRPILSELLERKRSGTSG